MSWFRTGLLLFVPLALAAPNSKAQSDFQISAAANLSNMSLVATNIDPGNTATPFITLVTNPHPYSWLLSGSTVIINNERLDSHTTFDDLQLQRGEDSIYGYQSAVSSNSLSATMFDTRGVRSAWQHVSAATDAGDVSLAYGVPAQYFLLSARSTLQINADLSAQTACNLGSTTGLGCDINATARFMVNRAYYQSSLEEVQGFVGGSQSVQAHLVTDASTSFSSALPGAQLMVTNYSDEPIIIDFYADAGLSWAMVTALQVPEPSTLLLFGFGMTAVGWVRRRRNFAGA